MKRWMSLKILRTHRNRHHRKLKKEQKRYKIERQRTKQITPDHNKEEHGDREGSGMQCWSDNEKEN